MLSASTDTVPSVPSQPTRSAVRSGVITGASSVETVVMPTEKATSPLQRKDIRFDETPPGQQPTRMSPTPTPR